MNSRSFPVHWVNYLVKTSLDRYWRESPFWQQLLGQGPRRVAFNTAFPEAEKHHSVPPQQVPTPNLLHTPLAPDAAHHAREVYEIPEDFVTAIPGGLIAATNSVVLSEDRNVIDESSTAAGLQYFLKREFFLSPTPLPGTAALLRSRFHNFYHWVIDFLPRLIALSQSPWANDGPIDLLYTGEIAPYEQFFLDHFEDGLFRLRRIEDRTVYRVETLLFTPLKTTRFAGFLPSSYVKAINSLFTPKRPRRRNRRLIISRAHAQYRHVANEDALLDALSEYGFERLCLEKLDPREQIAAFYDAEAVIAPHGAGLTHLLYADQAHVLEIFPNPVVTPHYLFLSKSLGHNYNYLCGTADQLNPKRFEIDVSAVCQMVDTWDLKPSCGFKTNIREQAPITTQQFK